jgi:AmiR/NasT family two-component response regulator
MTAQRLIQNFRQCRAVLLESPDFHVETLERTLLRLGVSLVRFDQVEVGSLDDNRDILFIDADQPFSPAALLAVGSSLPVAPVIGIVGVEAPSRLKLLSEAGATSLLRKPVAAAAVYSALFLGVNNYRRLHAMEERLAEQGRRRHGRRFLVKAVVALCQARGLSDEEAYAELRRESMRRRVGIEEFCEALFAEGSSFPGNWPVSSAQQREFAHASFSDAGGCADGAGDTADGESRAADQARRA